MTAALDPLPATRQAQMPRAAVRPLRVLMMPDYRRDNPYQSLLAEALTAENVETVFPAGYRRVLPLWRAVRDHRPIDVLHLHWTEPYLKGKSPFTAIAYWIKLLGDLSLVRLSGVRVAWTLHNLLPHECRRPRLERWMRRRLARLAHITIAHGEKSRADAVADFGCQTRRTVIAPHGHYRAVYPAATPQLRQRGRSHTKPDAVVFLFLGLMRPYKGLERLLRLWRRLRPAGAQLWLKGVCPDPAYEATLRELAAGMEDVRMECGFVSADDLAEAFAACDVVILPFEQVQTSGSALLALSYGKPLIAPRLGELPEALGGADDLLYQPGGDSSLSAAIQQALQIDLDDVGRRCRRAGDALDWDRAAQATAKAYHGR